MKIIQLVILSTVFVTYGSNAIPLLLTHEPLFLNQTVPPALAVTFDDSGSMSWGFMPSGRAYVGAHASTASPAYNEIYYNPTINYVPPVQANGASLPNSVYTSAKNDGFYAGNDATALGSTTDLSTNFQMVWTTSPNYADGTSNVTYQTAARPTSNAGYYYAWTGPGVPNNTATIGTGVNEYTLNLIGNAQEQNFANWYTYYNTRGKLAKAAISLAFVNFGPDFKIDWQQLNALSFNAAGTNMDLFTGAQRTNFYNWLYQVPAAGGTPLRAATQRAGNLFTAGNATSGPYYDVNFNAELSCQQNFHIAISDGGWNSAAGVAGNLDNVNNIALPALDDGSAGGLVYTYHNSALPSSMYSDGNTASLADNAFAFWSNDLRPLLDNAVPPYIEDYTDSDGMTVAIASGDQWWQEPELFWNPLNDPATWQHMVNFNIGLGVQGSLDPTTQLADLRDGTITTWPGTGTNQGLIDDVWHASLNSRGKYFSARDPLELANALNQVVTNIINRKGRASAGSVSSNVISNQTSFIKTGYDTADWSGFVTSSPVDNSGVLGVPTWDAGCELTFTGILSGQLCSSTGAPTSGPVDHSNRNILSYQNGTQFDFDAGSIPAALLTTINNSDFLTLNPSLNASDIINYIRGERTNEISSGGILRSRQSVLGDIINSPGKIIRGPGANYKDDKWPNGTIEQIVSFPPIDNGYKLYRELHEDRDNVIVVGANDGMLHSFAAGIKNTTNGGEEYWAYIPSSSYELLPTTNIPKIVSLANPTYKHTSFVDAAPFVRDVYINGDWTTTAVGHLRHGGKLFYALDLGSDPTAVPSVLWEFSEADDPDMGFTYSGAITAMVYEPSSNNSKWVAFLPNGYDSTSQQAVMYAVDLETGTLLHKWTTGIGSIAEPNGMGPPTASDFIVYADAAPYAETYGADQSADFIYAGDLHGNVYRFDAQDIWTSGTTTAEIFFDGSIDQPITTAPRVFETDNQEIMVVFGTGKYIETPDRDIVTTPSQYLIGLRDTNTRYPLYTSLSDSRIIAQDLFPAPSNPLLFRNITEHPVGFNESWKIELVAQGERIVNPLFRNNPDSIVGITTIVPNGTNPCQAGGKSWIMFFNAMTGGNIPGGNFFNGGESIGAAIGDLVLGFKILQSIGGNSTTLNVDTVGSGGGTDIVNIVIPTKKWGRKSWHRIILD